MQDDSQERPRFLDRLPKERAMPRYGIVRTPPRKTTVYLVLSDRALIMPTHWNMARTTPCHDPNYCEGCESNIEKRLKCYIAVCTPSTGLIQILELTDRGGQPVEQFQDKNGSIRGRKITVWREGKKDNSPVAALIAPLLDPTIHVPDCPDVQEFLYRMWYVKRPMQKKLPLTTDVEPTEEKILELAQALKPTNGHVATKKKGRF